ncbi:MAG: hypothetical protein R2838_09475 [Caldilineaceae bacterium]
MISIILMLFDAVKDLTELADRESAHSILSPTTAATSNRGGSLAL